MNAYSKKEIVTLEKEALPLLLRQIPDPPQSLFACGNTSLLSNHDTSRETKFLCVVGSRRFTSYGQGICQTFIKSLTGLPVVIVSGLALGIDGIAHRAALDAGLKTIAVPGSGLDPDIIYPRTHAYLAEEIVKKDGLLLSEYPPTMRASPWSFPMRNRIMAGMSHAVLIIEAEEDSGTLITARLALDYNRDVGCIPGSILSENSRGTNSLIRKGAAPITTTDELKELLGFDIIQPPLFDGKDIHPNPYHQCSKAELSVIDNLREPLSRDNIALMCKLPISQLHVILSMLEIRGLISESYGMVALRYPPPRGIILGEDLAKQ